MGKNNSNDKKKKRLGIFGLILLVINIVVACLMIMAVFAGYFKPSNNGIIACIGMLFSYFLLANIFFLIVFIAKGSKLFFISLISIFIALPSASRVIKFGNKNNEEVENTLKIASFNVKNLSNSNNNFNDKDIAAKIFELLDKTNADVIMLQEFYSSNIYMFENLKDKTDAKYHCYTKYYPSSRTCLAILSKYKLFNIESIRDNKKSFALYCDMAYNGDTIRIINTHLQSLHLNLDDPNLINESKNVYNKLTKAFAAREKQTDILVELIENSAHRIILCGDFNDTPNSYTYHKIHKHLTDVFIESGKGLGFTFRELPLMRIDYMFHSEGIKSTEFDIVRIKGLSDHDLTFGKYIVE